jgi:hypothetical protein
VTTGVGCWQPVRTSVKTMINAITTVSFLYIFSSF